MIRISTRIATLSFALAACSEQSTAPANSCAALGAQTVESLATIQWNARTRALVTKYRTDPSARPYALVSMAQLNATAAAEASTVAPCVSSRAAVASASAAVLTSLYPGEATGLDSAVRAQITADSLLGATGLVEGEAAGRRAAEPILTIARNDGLNAAFTTTLPIGPGMWFSSAKPAAPPATPMLGKMRPWVLSSGNQFRPAAPPAFGSEAFQKAVAEVKSIATGRTAEQLAVAQKWALSGGTFRTQGQWNLVASDILAARRVSERVAAHTLATLNVAMNDASIGCFDAKYTFWLLRPSQVDSSISLPIGLPNHPAYPSSHSCTSGAGAEVLATLYPSEGARMRALADEIGMSRLYAGIHYRFDIDAGLALGERAARLTLEVDRTKGLLVILR